MQEAIIQQGSAAISHASHLPGEPFLSLPGRGKWMADAPHYVGSGGGEWEDGEGVTLPTLSARRTCLAQRWLVVSLVTAWLC